MSVEITQANSPNAERSNMPVLNQDFARATRANDTVVLFEDDETIASTITRLLRSDGYSVRHYGTIKNAIEEIKFTKPAIILIDIMFADSVESGLDVCRALRADPDPEIAKQLIIIISCKSLPQEVLTGLDCANDYLIKPFLYQELRARIDALLRRDVMKKVASDRHILQYGDIQLDPKSHLIKRNSRILRLTPVEFWIMHALMQNTHRVLKREELIEEIWGTSTSVEARTIDVHITRLRKTLIQVSSDNIDVIVTVRLIGYKLNHPLYY